MKKIIKDNFVYILIVILMGFYLFLINKTKMMVCNLTSEGQQVRYITNNLGKIK